MSRGVVMRFPRSQAYDDERAHKHVRIQDGQIRLYNIKYLCIFTNFQFRQDFMVYIDAQTSPNLPQQVGGMNDILIVLCVQQLRCTSGSQVAKVRNDSATPYSMYITFI